LTGYLNSPPFEEVFFGNLNCSAAGVSSAQSGVEAAAVSTCDVTGITVGAPANGASVIFKALPVKDDTTLSIKNNIRGGYKAQISLP